MRIRILGGVFVFREAPLKVVSIAYVESAAVFLADENIYAMHMFERQPGEAPERKFGSEDWRARRDLNSRSSA